MLTGLRVLTTTVVCRIVVPIALHAQVLETETARQLRRGQLEVSAGYELQHSREGDESPSPSASNSVLTNRLAILVEPGCRIPRSDPSW